MPTLLNTTVPATTNYTVRYLDAGNREIRNAGRGSDPCTGCPVVLRVSPQMDKDAQHKVKREAEALFPLKPILLLEDAIAQIKVRDNDPAHFGRTTAYAVRDLVAFDDVLKGTGDWALQPFRVRRTFHNPWRGDMEIITLLEAVPFFYPLDGEMAPAEGEVPAYVRRMDAAANFSFGRQLVAHRIFAGANLRLAQIKRVGSEMLLADETLVALPKPPRQRRVAAGVATGKGRRR